MVSKRIVLKIDASKDAFSLEPLNDKKIIGAIDYAVKENMEKRVKIVF